MDLLKMSGSIRRPMAEMTQTDLVSLDRVTPTVYNAFVSGPYASWVVDDVTMVEFPKWQAIIVIKVGQDNVDIKYQLFYTPKGILLKNTQCPQLYDTTFSVRKNSLELNYIIG